MVHLPVHLAREARLCSPVQFRWMYPFERYMKTLKYYVRNRARPEGCIAESYLAEECIAFCSEFLKKSIQMEEKEARNEDIGDNVILEGRPVSKATSITLTDKERDIAHRCVLLNKTMMDPLLDMHLEELQAKHKRLAKNGTLLWKQHTEKIAAWTKNKLATMVGGLRKTCHGKRKNSKETGGRTQDFDAMEENPIEDHPEINKEETEYLPFPSNDNPEQDDDVQEDAPVQDTCEDPRGLKKRRGPTKMKKVASEAEKRIELEFNKLGEPIGQASIGLSSFLGPLVREHVPVTLDDWRNLSDDLKVALWEEVEARYILDEEWQKNAIFKAMGCLWRASKSRLVSKIRCARSKETRIQLKPDNIPTLAIWNRFVETKRSPAFKAISEKYRAMRLNQVPHTCSHKGMARLAADMKRNSADPSFVTRVKVWIKSHTKKDGTPVNTTVGETIERLKQVESNSLSSTTSNVREDALSQVLGKDKPGRLRGMGRGATITKLSFVQARDKYVLQLEEEQSDMKSRINQLEGVVHKYIKARQTMQTEEDDENGYQVEKNSSVGINPNYLDKCTLLDWSGTDEIVAEGRWCSNDPNELVNHTPIGPNAIKVVVDFASKPDSFLWRPTPSMSFMEQAQGRAIVWPADKVVLQNSQQSEHVENISVRLSKNNNSIKCKLFNWSGKEEIVAEGHWFSNDPKMLVNDIPLGPNAMIVSVEIRTSPEAFLWRPTPNMTYIEDAIGTKIAWPADKVALEKIPNNEEV